MTFAFSETVTDMPSLSPAANAICKTINYSRQSPSPSTIPADFIVGLRRSPDKARRAAPSNDVHTTQTFGDELVAVAPKHADESAVRAVYTVPMRVARRRFDR